MRVKKPKNRNLNCNLFFAFSDASVNRDHKIGTSYFGITNHKCTDFDRKLYSKDLLIGKTNQIYDWDNTVYIAEMVAAEQGLNWLFKNLGNENSRGIIYIDNALVVKTLICDDKSFEEIVIKHSITTNYRFHLIYLRFMIMLNVIHVSHVVKKSMDESRYSTRLIIAMNYLADYYCTSICAKSSVKLGNLKNFILPKYFEMYIPIFTQNCYPKDDFHLRALFHEHYKDLLKYRKCDIVSAKRSERLSYNAKKSRDYRKKKKSDKVQKFRDYLEEHDGTM